MDIHHFLGVDFDTCIIYRDSDSDNIKIEYGPYSNFAFEMKLLEQSSPSAERKPRSGAIPYREDCANVIVTEKMKDAVDSIKYNIRTNVYTVTYKPLEEVDNEIEHYAPKHTHFCTFKHNIVEYCMNAAFKWRVIFKRILAKLYFKRLLNDIRNNYLNSRSDLMAIT